jgi:hypothetical protein
MWDKMCVACRTQVENKNAETCWLEDKDNLKGNV